MAQRRLARGVKLNVAEAVGLIASVLLEMMRDGKTVEELMEVGRKLLGKRQVRDTLIGWGITVLLGAYLGQMVMRDEKV